MLIVAALEKRGISTSFVLLRLRILSYVHQYRRLTLEESGRAGGLFYSFIISMNLALVAAVAGAIALAV